MLNRILSFCCNSLLKSANNQFIEKRINQKLKLSMDPCFVDLTVEFLGVTFHNILYYTDVYPKSIFEARRKYSIVVYRSKHPEVNQYIDLCLKSVAECLKNGNLSRVEMAITDDKYETIMKFIFDFNRQDNHSETPDAYLIQCEQNLRAFCLNLVTASKSFQDHPKERSFSIYLHTNESNAVMLATNPDLEDFPLVEVEEKCDKTERIIPLRCIPIRNFNMDTYIEL